MTPDDFPRSPPAVARRLFGAELPRAIRYAEILCAAGVTRGMIGPGEVPRIWARHLVNSALLAEHVPRDATVVDIGSGAGLPGIPLWLARPDLTVTLVEPMLRRVRFLREIVDALELPLDVVRARAEDLPPAAVDVVVARAVAPLIRLIPLTVPLVRPGGRVLALKGVSASAEIATATPLLRQWPGAHLTPIAAGDAETATTIICVLRGTPLQESMEQEERR